jgi:putative ABC transport system permease protein
MTGSRARLAAALRLGLRELRGTLARSLRGFGVFVACLALGVAAIAGVGSLGRAFEATLAAQGDAILGGDVAFSLNHQPPGAAEKAFLATRGAVSEIATLRAMARTPDGERTALVETKAVDAAYPLVGRLTLPDGRDARPLLAPAAADAPAPALAEETLLERLKVAVGDEIALGGARLRIVGVIGEEPDRLAAGLGFGPRLLISLDALRATGLLAPGSLVRWHERLRLAPAADEAAIRTTIAEVQAAFPHAGWEIRSRADAAPGTRSTIERFVQFLTLVGFTTLVIGGIGVANAVSGHLERRRRTIAVWRALGATRAQILIVHGVEIGAIAAIGIALGLAVGIALPHLLAGPLADTLGVPLVPVAAPADWALAVLEGALTAALFAWIPLVRAVETPPAVLFRDAEEAAGQRRLPPGLVVTALIGLALVALVVATAPDRRITTPYLAVLAAALIGLRLVASGLVAGLRRLPRPPVFEVRAAIAAMVGPRAATGSILASIGLGATLIVALLQIEQGLLTAVERTIPGVAPSFFFLDVPAREADAFRAFLGREAADGRIEDVPMLRGRITALKGVPVEEAKIEDRVRFVLAGDRGVTFSATPPANSTVVEGAWWAPDHAGPPLVSFDADTAKGLGLAIGDTLRVNVLGREIEARVANFRKIEWDRLAINFFMVFSPDAFRGAPVTRLATVTFPKGAGEARERGLLRAVVDRFPVVTAVRVKDALAQVDALVRRSAAGISVVAGFAVVAATLVLAGSLAARAEARIRNAAVLVALGAARRRLIGALALEFALLGLLGGLFGAVLGTLAARHVLTGPMHLPFAVAWAPLAATLLGALLATLLLGLAATRAALSARPSEILRATG